MKSQILSVLGLVCAFHLVVFVVWTWMHLCFYYLFRIVLSSWWIICRVDTKRPSLCLLISFGEVCLSDTLLVSWLYLLGLFFSYSFTLRYLSLMLRYISWRQQNYGSCFLIPFDSLCLYIGWLRTFLLLVITSICILIPVFDDFCDIFLDLFW